MSTPHAIKTNVYDQKKVYSDFELNIEEINASISDFIQNGRGCPVILSGLGPI